MRFHWFWPAVGLIPYFIKRKQMKNEDILTIKVRCSIIKDECNAAQLNEQTMNTLQGPGEGQQKMNILLLLLNTRWSGRVAIGLLLMLLMALSRGLLKKLRRILTARQTGGCVR